MKRRPLVSVIIPAYNEEKDIGRCLESLMRQSYKKIEVIVIDDGSTDRTLGIVRRFPVTLLKQEHQGPGVARNTGAKVAKGELLVFVDADTAPTPTYIEKLIVPVLKGEVIGTNGSYAFPENMNFWERGWSIKSFNRAASFFNIFACIPRAIFLKKGGFDTSRGYYDDILEFEDGKPKSKRVDDAHYIQYPPATMKDTLVQARWVGRSHFKSTHKKLTQFMLFLFHVFASIFPLLLLVSFVYPAILGLAVIIVLVLLNYQVVRRYEHFRKHPLSLFPYQFFRYVYSLGYTVGMLEYLLGKRTVAR